MEIHAKSVEAALREAEERFGLRREEIEHEVLEEGGGGFLGFGGKPARVRVALRRGAAAAYAERVLSRILKDMGLPDRVVRKRDPDGNIVLNLQGPSSGALIGRRGQTLEALQFLLSKILNRLTDEERTLVVVDVEDYLLRQRDKLRRQAEEAAQRAAETGQEVALKPMSARERRVVHMTLRDSDTVTTQSTGEGSRRRVVIRPKGRPQGENGSSPQAAPPAPAAASPPAEVLDDYGNRVEEEETPPDDIGNR